MTCRPRTLFAAAVSVFLISLLVLSLACNGPRHSNSLLIYTPHGQDMLRDFVARYKQAHPEADVQFLDMGSREVLERIRAERNRPQADLWWGAAHTTFQTAADENLLAPYQPTWADKVPDYARDAEGRWYGTYETPEVIVYNSSAVRAEEAPKDWDEVIDPKWRDKVLIRNPNPSDTMRAIFGAMIWRFYKDTKSADQGYDWLRKLDANVHEYTADGTLLMQKLARQEGLITLWDMPDIATLQQRFNIPVDYIIPSSGTPLLVDGIAIVRGAKHPVEAKEYYEFVTTPEAMIAAADSFLRIPARKDIPLSQLPAWIRDAMSQIKPMPVDRELMATHLDEWMK